MNEPDRIMGVFAKQNIQPDEELGEYKGETLTQTELDKRYPGEHTPADYAFEMSNGKYKDAKDPHQGSIARWINHSKHPNAEVMEKHGRLYVISTSTIAHDTEIFIDYNPSNLARGYEWATSPDKLGSPKIGTSPTTRHTTNKPVAENTNQTNQDEYTRKTNKIDIYWAKYHHGLTLAPDQENRRGNRQYCYYDLTMGVDRKSCPRLCMPKTSRGNKPDRRRLPNMHPLS